MKLLSKYSRLYPIGRTVQAHLQGWMAYLEGKETRATQLWTDGLRLAVEHQQPYEAWQIRQTRYRLLGRGYPQQATDEEYIHQFAEQLSRLAPPYEKELLLQGESE